MTSEVIDRVTRPCDGRAMTHSEPLTAPLTAMAIGRIALGAASLIAPGALARTFGTRSSPELDYLTRVFGARAIALGTAYLLGDARERARLQRLCVAVDVSDTVAGISELVKGSGGSRRSLATSVIITGPYAAIGVARLLSDVRRAGS
jgi:hypothetical protein